jgi:hypothetical protein
MAKFIEFEKTDLEKLVDYVKVNGGFVGNIDFRKTEDEGVGVFTQADSISGEKLITIPFKLCLSTDLVLESPLRIIFDERPSILEFPDEVLAIGLLYAKTNSNVTVESCPWLLHVRTMPESFNTTIFWTEEEMQELKDCNIFHLTRLMKRQMEADWEALHQSLVDEYPDLLGGATIEDYRWALSAVYSRAVGIIKDGKYVRCMPPVIDMANHNPEAGAEAADTFQYDPIVDTITLLNTTDKKADEECFAVYGTYPNSKLLYTYGFCAINNPHRAVDLWTRVAPQISNAAEKQRILDSHSLTQNQTYDFNGTIRPNYVSPALLATIRVIQANEEELANVENAYKGEMISVRNEHASYLSLRGLLVQRMKVEVAQVRILFSGTVQIC